MVKNDYVLLWQFKIGINCPPNMLHWYVHITYLVMWNLYFKISEGWKILQSTLMHDNLLESVDIPSSIYPAMPRLLPSHHFLDPQPAPRPTLLPRSPTKPKTTTTPKPPPLTLLPSSTLAVLCTVLFTISWEGPHSLIKFHLTDNNMIIL